MRPGTRANQWFLRSCAISLTILSIAVIAAAQTKSVSVSGQIIAPDGEPWADIDVLIQNANTGQHFDVKTDKNGRYTQLGLLPGVYKITIQDRHGKEFIYSEIHTLYARENELPIDFSTSSQSAARKTIDGEEDKFGEVKAHLDAGLGAMYDSESLRTRLTSAPPNQRVPIQEELNSDYKKAIREFRLAEQADSPADEKNLAIIWAHLGEAYQYAGQFDDAIDSYQKAIAVLPEAWSYQNLGEVQARAALATTDPTGMEQKLASAGATCDRIVALESLAAARCWKNIGRLLTNKSDMKAAVMPLQKTLQLNPKDSEAWFLLGRALLTMPSEKQQGDKTITVFPPETAEAFQNCIQIDPNGPYAPKAKEVLNELASMSIGQQRATDGKKK